MTDKDKNINKVPNLRFPGFEGEWEVRKLGDNCNILMCKRIFAEQTNEYGEIPFYKIGTIGRNPDSFISKSLFEEYKTKYNYPKKGEILITCSGTVGKCIVFDGNDAYYQDSNIVWIDNPTLEIQNEFLYYLLYNFDWGKLNSTTITRIYGSDLRNLKLNFPKNIKEQNKISSFLGSLDERIASSMKTIEELNTFKKGIAKKIFSQQLRFKDDNGNYFPEWESKMLGEVLDYEQPTKYLVATTEYDDSFKTPVVTAGKTFILGYTNEEENIFEKEKLPVIIFDDFTTASQFIDFPFKAKSSAMKILKAQKGNDIKFIFEAMQMISYETGGHGRHWISVFSNLEISLPTLSEQQKIANFLSSIDSKIDIENQILQKLEEQKKYFLGNLFI